MLYTLLAVALSVQPARAPIPVGSYALPAEAHVQASAPQAPQSLRLSLKLRDRAGLEQLLVEQRTPGSAMYRRWLTPTEFGERFGVPEGDYQALVAALTAAGLEVRTFPNRLYVEGEGTVQSVSRLLSAHFVDVESGTDAFRAIRGSPTLPANLAPMILAALGIDTRHRFHHRLNVGAAQTMGPQDLRRYYGIEDLHALGFAGQLSKVAAMGTIPSANNAVNPADIQYFYSAVSDSSAQFILDTLPLGSSSPDGEFGLKVELEMDSEMSTVASPLEQSVTLVLAPADTLFTSAMNEVDNNLSDVTAASISFGGCELLESESGPAGEIQAVADLVAQGASEGISYFSASGDDGVLTCLPDSSDPGFTGANTPSVDFPSGVPYITAVGGSMYTGAFDADGGVTAYGDETAWNEPSLPAAGGGGVSILFARPPWQTGPGTSDGGFREVPDIALLASTVPGVAIVSTRPGQIDAIGNGTSDAAPMAAGMFALINDYAGGCRLGGINPELYALGRAQYTGGAAVFHDITTGNISIMGTTAIVTGPSAGVGYDEATGLGSIDVAALAAAWEPCPTSLPVVDAGSPDAGPEIDAGSAVDAGPIADAGVVDAGPAPDAGPTDAGSAIDAGPPQYDWDGGVIGWAALAVDAGPRVAYDACATLACDLDAGATCLTTVEGPASCQVPCDVNNPVTCAADQFCGDGICQYGCISDSECQVDAGMVCETCAHACVRAGNPDAGVGEACAHRTDCATGGTCYNSHLGFPNGYCTITCGFATCGCPPGSECLGADPSSGQDGSCYATCSVASQNCSRNGEGYVCQPVDATDTGICFPQCGSDADCQSEVGPDTICSPTTHYCVSATTSTSSSGSTSGSTSATSISSSSSTSSSASASSGAAGSSAASSGSGSSGTASGATSSGTSASSATASSTSASTSSGITATEASATGSSTGGGGKGKSGCGCNSPAGLDPIAIFGALAALATRRRRRS